jgi:hypothetical protein
MIGAHTRPVRGASDDWLTPPEILRALGPFDLDPCASHFEAWRPWETAPECWTWGGLERAWHGFVWLNPPYGPQTWPWLARLADYGRGIALTFARTETDGFHAEGWRKSAALLFLRGRLHFHHPNGERAAGNAGGPSVLLAYSDEGARRLATCKLDGHLVIQSATILTFEDGAPVGTWRDAVRAAMDGRTLRLRELYSAAEGTPKVREAKAAGHNWRAQLRRTLQRHFAPAGPATWAPA